MRIVRDSQLMREELRRKHELRRNDARALASGEKSPAEVRDQNSHFVRFEARINLDLEKLVP